MRLKGSAPVLEDRRRRALRLVRRGMSFNEAGRKIGCAASSVMRWYRSFRAHGDKGLLVKFSPGRPLRLSAAKRRRLLALLLRGAMSCGYRTELWTTARIANVIATRFGVKYHPDHVGRLLHALGWSPQKPERRAMERDEAEITRWKREEWPRVKKTLRGWAPTSYSRTNPAFS